MKLNRALSEKNRMARKIKDLQSKITSHNSYIKGNMRNVKCLYHS